MALLIPAMAAAMALAAILLYRWLRLLSARRRSAALPPVPALLMQRRRCPPPWQCLPAFSSQLTSGTHWPRFSLPTQHQARRAVHCELFRRNGGGPGAAVPQICPRDCCSRLAPRFSRLTGFAPGCGPARSSTRQGGEPPGERAAWLERAHCCVCHAQTRLCAAPVHDPCPHRNCSSVVRHAAAATKPGHARQASCPLIQPHEVPFGPSDLKARTHTQTHASGKLPTLASTLPGPCRPSRVPAAPPAQQGQKQLVSMARARAMIESFGLPFEPLSELASGSLQFVVPAEPLASAACGHHGRSTLQCSMPCSRRCLSRCCTPFVGYAAGAYDQQLHLPPGALHRRWLMRSLHALACAVH